MLNLNRNKAYKKFRKTRLKTFNLEILTKTLYNYSGIGKKYGILLMKIIKKLKKERYV